MTTPLHFSTIAFLSEALRAGKISSVQLMQDIVDRTRQVEPRVGAFISYDETDALAQARASDVRRAEGRVLGPLDGIPIGLKDVIAVTGQPLTAASRMLDGFVSPYDATVTRKLKAAGAICWGRLNLDEFAMGSSTENSAYKPAHNPYDLECVPGGSSGGSAAAVAAGCAIATLGSDTGGSIRQPASFCNLVGFKPTYGLVSRYGLIAYASSLDQIGPLTRTLEDAALLLSAIAGHDSRDSTSYKIDVPDYRVAMSQRRGPWRLGIPKEYFGEGLDPEVDAAVQVAIAHYRGMGCEICPVSLPHTQYGIAAYYIIASAECSSNLARFDGVRYGHRSKDAKDVNELYFKSRAEGFGQEVKRRIVLGTYVLSSGYYDAYYLRAQKVRTLIRNDFLAAYKQVDAILTPVAPTPAFRHGAKKDPLALYLNDIYTIGVNLAGLPAVSVPCGFTRAGLPVGMQLIGQPFQEAELFAIGRAYEKDHPWGERRPAI